MPVQLLTLFAHAKMDRDRKAHAGQHVIEHQGLPQARPWEEREAKQPRLTQPYNRRDGIVHLKQGPTCPARQRQAVQEARQGIHTQAQWEPTEPEAHSYPQPAMPEPHLTLQRRYPAADARCTACRRYTSSSPWLPPQDTARQDLTAWAPATLLPLLHHLGWVKLKFKGLRA
jgi:hypothetical protein